ncbi:MAG: T9SS type A sorting domain-containing protein [Marinilabiliaceae bacterium]|nr:T9SS type A sorting domain-containing protein [Marinilabiliaceae bacterium]
MSALPYPYASNLKNKLVIIIAIFLISLSSYGQELSPGGVTGARLWKVTEETQGINAGWKSMLPANPGSALSLKGAMGSINNNPALYLNGSEPGLTRTINLGSVPAFSLFTVCQQKDTLLEKIILSIENDSLPEVVLTDRRMAALDVYRYTDFSRGPEGNPRIYSYIQNKPGNTTIAPTILRFGEEPDGQKLPVSAFTGLIPEIILFERVISPLERKKVESYLALKYGITLNQEFPSSYLNSRGELIWDSETGRSFNNNIAGIGRDDLSGLCQRISESTLTRGVMKIGTESSLEDLSFYVWGDNNKPMVFSETHGVEALRRAWRISVNSKGHEPVFVETAVSSLSEIDPLGENEVFWLMIDHSGSASFPFRQNTYHQCEHAPLQKGLIHFSPVCFDNDGSGADVFTIIKAPSFFVRTIVNPPLCTEDKYGTIKAEIAGGISPFKISLYNISDNSSQLLENEKSRYIVFENISQGSYLINASDAAGKVYSEEIWISNKHPWETGLKENYLISEGQELYLDAAMGMPAASYTYLWTLPDGSGLSGQDISISEPGNYFLSVTDNNNCSSTSPFRVELKEKSLFDKVELYPNPGDGLFVLRINLAHRQDVYVSISDMSGKILINKSLRNDRYYTYSGFIERPGTYFISLKTINEVVTLKLVVK